MAEKPYAKELIYLWGLSNKGALTSTNTILKDLKLKVNMPDLQAELAQMNVKFI